MEKKLKVIDCIEAFLGRKGRLVSMSKSCGPAMAVYNSNLVVGDKVLWHGDIDLERDKAILLGIARLFEVDIEVYYEMDLRIFPGEFDTDIEVEQEHKKRIAANTPVWTTKDPFTFAGKDWDEMLDINSEHRAEMMKRRMMAYGFLTPGGTDWKWYNTWYYKGPHKLYRCFRFFYNQFIAYPLESIDYHKSKYVDGERVEIKLSVLDKIRIFVRTFIKEIGYHKKAFETGEIKSVREYLFDH
jgi:hypothetical protein